MECEPKYKLLTDKIEDMILLRKLNKGDKLPSIRNMSKNLLISAITVRKAYSNLESKEILFTNPSGMYISNNAYNLVKAGISLNRMIELLRQYY